MAEPNKPFSPIAREDARSGLTADVKSTAIDNCKRTAKNRMGEVLKTCYSANAFATNQVGLDSIAKWIAEGDVIEVGGIWVLT